MAKGANGTIRINTQTIKQREKISNGGETNLGVAIDRFGSDNSLFGGSPIALNSQPEMYRGDAAGNGQDLQDVGVDSDGLYKVYRKVVDPSTDGVEGFGFSGNDHPDSAESGTAYLNYQHPNNPFIVDNKLNLQSLTSGETYTDTKAYKGFPDLSVSDLTDPLDNPTEHQGTQPTSNLEKAVEGAPENINARALTGDGASWGASIDESRNLNDNFLGHYYESNNLDKDLVGKYFKTKYTTPTP